MFPNSDVNRFSRQILLNNVGIYGQNKLKGTSVLIVGAGGLGCPCALYLATAGIGHLGLVDYDEVELNNLHRQILHKESDLGRPKVESAHDSLKERNSCIKVTPYKIQLDRFNALPIFRKFDIIVDASDNPATRYLVNDACVLINRPLVWGGAIQQEGQLTVYHYNNGPCYRCIFPDPPPPETISNCGESGVLGPVPGTIGLLQAIQVINLVLGFPTLSGKLLLFDAYECNFRRVNLRARRSDCAVCGDNPTVKELLDYEVFSGAKACDKTPNLCLLSDRERISVNDYNSIRDKAHILVDVRSAGEFQICSLPGSINVPIRTFTSGEGVQKIKSLVNGDIPVFVICRRGNDSQRAVLQLKDHVDAVVKDIIGGLHAWSRLIDPDFPIY